MTDFSTVTELTPTGERRWAVELPADWVQGRTMFGGLVGALAARAAAEVAGPDRPLRSLDVAFVAPLPAGPATVAVELLGAGKAVSQLLVTISAGGSGREAGEGEEGGIGARVHVVAGAPRRSAIRVDAAPAARTPGEPLEQGLDLPYLPGLTPVFTQNLEFRWCSPAFPYTGGGPQEARIDGWVRHRTPAEGLPALIALIDAWPPATLIMTTGPTPVSTIRWSVHLAPAALGNAAFSGKEWVWYENRLLHAADGYSTSAAAIHSPTGQLLAWSEQLNAVYDRP